MATYQPPTEILPKFNEFVFNQANEPEYLDQLVVHKAGTETITGVKTITGDFYINNLITTIVSATSFTISSAINFLNGTQNRIASSLALTSTSIGNKIDCQGGYNLMTSATTAPFGIANWIEATNGGTNAITTNGTGGTTIRIATGVNVIENTAGSNVLEALTTGTNTIRSATGTNTMTSGKTTGSANLIEATGAGINEITSASGALGANTITATSGTAENIIQATAAGGGNRISATSGTNTIVATTGRNTLTTAGTNATANLIEATALLGGNTIRATAATGTNTISATAGGSNTMTTTSGTNTISATAGGNNTITTTTGTNTIRSATGQNLIENTGGSNVLESLTTGANTIRSASGDNILNSTSGSNRIQINGTNKIVVNGTDTSITNNTTTINGAVVVKNTGAPSLYLVGNNTDGTYISLFPDGNVLNRKAYIGYPSLSSVVFTLANEYTNGQFNHIINNISKLSISTAVTTITNTTIYAVGRFNATQYTVGSVSSNFQLVNLAVGGTNTSGTIPSVLINTTSFVNGTWGTTGLTSTRLPNWGTFVPHSFTIGFTGSFSVGSPSPTMYIIVYNYSTNTDVATSPPFTFVSSTTTYSLAAEGTFNSFPGTIIGGQLIGIKYAITTGSSAISGSSKVAFLQLYGYQSA